MQRAFLVGPRPFYSSPLFTRCALVALSVLSTSQTSFAWTPVSGTTAARTWLTLASLLSPSSTSSRLFSSATSSMSDACPSSTLTVAQFPCLDDNYGYLIHDETTGATAAVDTPDAAAYNAELQKRGWKLTHILNTHHHWDHTGGNAELKTEGVTVCGPAAEQAKIPGIDITAKAGDEIAFGSIKATVLDVGGHTLGHIAFYFPTEHKIFVGDSLFALGCGKMFEGTPSQFWKSMLGLRELSDETTVFCAHEYTASNAKFAASVEPGNAELMARVSEIYAARERGEATVPSQLGVEKRTNPFLRCDISEEVRKNVGVVPGDSDSEAFGKVRKAKDTFRG